MNTLNAAPEEVSRQNHLSTLKSQFEDDGYCISRGLFSPDETAAYRNAFMAEVEDGPSAGSEVEFFGKPYSADDPLARFPRIMNPHLDQSRKVGRMASDFLFAPRLHPILRSLLGEEPVGVQTMFYFKPPGARGQDLHQDNLYLRVKPGTCMAAWLAVDDADPDNGGMVVVPGSSRLEIACPQPSDSATSFTPHRVAVPAGLHSNQCR